ncbi:MAG: hypothetical protein ABSF69_22870 [Polyangiaceae bacterium]
MIASSSAARLVGRLEQLERFGLATHAICRRAAALRNTLQRYRRAVCDAATPSSARQL